MDSLGKVFDVFVIIMMLFVVPINWAINRNEEAGISSLDQVVENVLYKAEKSGKIEYHLLDELDYKLQILFGSYSVEFFVVRRIWDAEVETGNPEVVKFVSEIPYTAVMDEIVEKGSFLLSKNDMLIIDIIDDEGLLVRKMRLIT